MPDYEIWLTDRNLNVLTAPVVDWTTIDATLRFNEPGSALFTVPGYSRYRNALQPGTRAAVLWRPSETAPKEVLIAGPVEETMYERGDDGEHAGAGTLTVNFADDLAQIGTRITWPDTTLAPEDWAVDSWTYSGSAEVGMLQLALSNAGAGAYGNRAVPLLVAGNPAGATTSITIDTRLEPLLDVLRAAAVNAGGIGFRTRQGRNAIHFELYKPVDRSATVQYSYDRANIRYLSYKQQAPTATFALVGGQGEGADRYVIGQAYTPDDTTWGRAEVYVGRAGSGTTLELQDDANKALLDGRAVSQLTATTIDNASQRYGVHYWLGDTVAISPWIGVKLAAQVKTVHIQAWATAGELITPTIGDQGLTTDQGMIRKLRSIDQRVKYLERNVVPSA